MTDVQNEMINLLVELKEICNRNNLTYYLSPIMAAHGMLYGGFEKHIFIPTILMPAGDMLKLIRIIREENNTDRDIEYMGNNVNYPEYSVSYVNNNTSFIEMGYGTNSKKHGIRVKILPLCTSTKSRIAGVLETGWGDNAYRGLTKRENKRIIGKRIIGVLKHIGKDNFARWLFNFLSKEYTKDSESKKVFYKVLKQPRVYFDRISFVQNREIDFEGHRFCVPDDIEAYIEKGVGKIWRETLDTQKEKKDIIMSSNIPYRTMIEELENEGINISKIMEENSIIYEKTRKNSELRHSKNDAWVIALRSGERLKLYEELMSRWDEILEYKENNDYDELEKIFSRYDGLAKYYLNKKNLGLCPSKEFLEIECELMRKRGESDLADMLMRIAPKEHYEPIV